MEDIRGSLDEANRRVELLTRCIEKICVAGGMIRDDAFINGPQALQFGDEFAEYLNSQKARETQLLKALESISEASCNSDHTLFWIEMPADDAIREYVGGRNVKAQ